MKKVSIILLSLVLFASLTTAQAADEPKTIQPAQGMPTMDCPMMKGGDGKMMMHDMMKDMMTIQKQMLASPTG